MFQAFHLSQLCKLASVMDVEGVGWHSLQMRVWHHLVGSLSNRVLPGCRLVHSLVGCDGREPTSQVTVC